MCGIESNTSVDMDKQKIYKIIDNIRQSYRFRRKPVVNITGGEPFCREDIFDILEKLSSAGFCMTICTNGVLLDERKIKLLLSFKLKSLTISLDALDENVYQDIRGKQLSVMKTISAIKLIYKYQKINKMFHLALRTVLLPQNLHFLPRLFSFMQKFNAIIYFSHLSFITLKEQIEAGLFLGRYEFINPEGRFFICDKLPITAVFLKQIKKYTVNAQYFKRMSPVIKKNDINDYYLYPRMFIRGKNRCSLSGQLRIRSDGDVGFCVGCKGIKVNWDNMSVKDVYYDERLKDFRRVLDENNFDQRCARCDHFERM